MEKDKERRISIYKYKPLEQFQLLFVLPPPLLLDADSSCEYSPHGFLFDHPLPFFLPSIVSLDSVIIFPPTHGFCTRSKAISTVLYYFLIVFLSFLSFYIEREEKVGQTQGSYLGTDSVLIVNKHLWM